MRKFLIALLLGSVLIACKQSVKGKNGVSYSSAVQYNDYIVDRQTKLMKNVLEFGKMSDSQMDTADAALRRYANQAETMIGELKGMPAYKGDSALRDAAVRSFTFYKRVFETEYMDLLKIRQKGQENITPDDVAEANRIVESISKEEESFDAAFKKAQENYAERNHMKLKNNSLQDDLNKLKDN